MVKDYYDIRAVFKKTDRAIYISHLDLMRVMQRTFKRSKLPVWFTKGYNPHIYLMFPLPLSLGVSSDCEMMDFGIDMSSGKPDYNEIKIRLNEVLPAGIEVISVYEPKMPHTAIGASEYTVRFVTDEPYEDVKSSFESFMAQESILIEKRAKVNCKKTIVTKDIKPNINVLAIRSENGCLEVDFRLPSGIKQSLNIVAVTSAFEAFYGKEFDKICANRTKILDADGADFM
ncbi:MAG: DUF2344 domain-containing protein [Oscillospiraceae bacterium]|nr:DUF2344 domain-containing protein [Oscillospiraceae bacterium]